jgi:glycosyltransferase involved in cell wall biosynthesis
LHSGFNFDITSLVNELSRQIELLNQPAEIVVIDDCSNEKYKNINRVVCQKHVYIELEKNIGRAKIRNLFLQFAKYDYLLFLDCDSSIQAASFLANYVENIGEKTAVVCGGRINDNSKTSRDKRLRWKYCIKREILYVEVRNKFTNN